MEQREDIMQLAVTGPWAPAEPLHRRAPARDGEGRPYNDFMMLIPGLRARPQPALGTVVREIELTLARFRHLVVFADLNLKLNILWVTVQPGRDVVLRVAAAIRARVPEAKLVAANHRYI
jgi:hypothetical protein